MSESIVCAGEIFIDQILSGFTVWPGPGEEAFATGYTREVGGGAAITGAGLARLGRNVQIAGVIGRDDAWAPERLRALGVGAGLLERHPVEPTGTTLAVSLSHERTFFTYRGASLALADALHALPGGLHLHLGCPPAPELLGVLRPRFGTLSIDSGFVREWLVDPATHEALRLVNWFLPNELEAALITGESDPEAMLLWFSSHGIAAAIKLGPRGSALLHEGRMILAPSIAVDPVDTTGAGDCFDAGFLDAWLDGAPPARCLRAGNICGALSTRAAGGIAAFPTREELLACL